LLVSSASTLGFGLLMILLFMKIIYQYLECAAVYLYSNYFVTGVF